MARVHCQPRTPCADDRGSRKGERLGGQEFRGHQGGSSTEQKTKKGGRRRKGKKKPKSYSFTKRLSGIRETENSATKEENSARFKKQRGPHGIRPKDSC